MDLSMSGDESGCSSDSNFSPPLSPVLGYSGIGDHCNVPPDSDLIFCFNCKGRPRPGSSDHSFSPDGYILRRELITTLENLSQDTSPHNNNDEEENDQMDFSDPHQRSFFFNQNLDPFDPSDCRVLLIKARKNIHILQIFSNPSRQCWEDSEDPDGPGKPWVLRRNVCQFFNCLTRKVKQMKSQLWRSEEDLERYFASFKDAFGNLQENWEEYLQTYAGNRDGNECPSPLYHLFHLMLEIRWSLLVIYGMSSNIMSWVLKDLIWLAWVTFTKADGRNIEASCLNKQPFNCWCVKELWTMIRLLCEELSINFWNCFGEALKIFEEGEEEVVPAKKFSFPLWLISHLCALSDYSLNGLYTPRKEKSEPSKINAYNLVNAIVKEWSLSGGEETSPCEIFQLLVPLVDYWGFDLDLVCSLWSHWLPKIGKYGHAGPSSLDIYGSVEKWTKLIKALVITSDSSSTSPQKRYQPETDVEKFILHDEFLSFLKLLVGHASLVSGKDWRKLKSHIQMNLNKNNAGSYGEIGLLRLSTLYIALSFATADTCAMCDTFRELFQYGKQSATRNKTVIRGTATAIHVLLLKHYDVSAQEITKSFMSTVNTLMSQLPLDSNKKDNVMVYLDLLRVLPSTAPFSGSTLGRDFLISPNLTMWLSSCGPNYVVRTLRILSDLTSWIISSKQQLDSASSAERDGLATKIFERVMQFLTQAVILNANRVPSTDVEPMANLAADLTLFSKWNGIANGPDSVPRLFEHFALNDRTCPEVSQFYVSRIIMYQDHMGGSISNLKWCQSWVRLCALDCTIPEELHQSVLDPGFSSTCNSDLLQKFCRKSEEWSRGDAQNILHPLPGLAKSAVGGSIFQENAASIVSSIVRTCSQLLEQMDFEKLYVKGDLMCIGTQLLNILVPPFVGVPPWEKLPRHAVSSLRDHLFNIFVVLVNYPGYGTDNFLQRKINDLITFAFLGYVDDNMEEDCENPGIKMLVYAEDNEIQYVLQICITQLSNIIKNEIKLMQRFVTAVSAIRIKQLSTTVIRFLPGILSVYVSANCPPEILNMCCGIVMYCCFFGLTPFKDIILQAFDSLMETTFAFKSKHFFDLAFALCKSPKIQAKKFLRNSLLPLYDHHVRLCESRRGTGTDNSLRGPLEKLDRDTIGFI